MPYVSTRTTRICFFVTCFASLLFPSLPAMAQGRLKIVGQTGDVVTNIDGWTVLAPALQRAGSIDDGKNVGYFAKIRRSSSGLEREALLWGTPGAAEVIAHVAMDAPGMPTGVKFFEFSRVNSELLSRVMNAAGDRSITFSAKANGGSLGGAGAYGHWVFREGQLSLLAATRIPTPGAQYDPVFEDMSLNAAKLSRDGSAAFLSRASVEIGGTRSSRIGLWSGTPGNLRAVALQGRQVPGLAPGVTYQTFYSNSADTYFNDPPLIRDSLGGVGYTAGIAGPGVSELNDTALFYSSTAGDQRVLVREGDRAPGIGIEAYFTQFDRYSSGTYASASAKGGNIVLKSDLQVSSSTFVTSLWRATDDALESIVYRGGPSPTGNPNEKAGNHSMGWVNASGSVLFQCWIDSAVSTDLYSAVFLDRGDTTEAIIGDDWLMPDGRSIRNLRPLAINDAGQCLIEALVGPGIDRVLIGFDPVEGLRPLIFEKQLLPMIPGFMNEVHEIQLGDVMLSEAGFVTFGVRVGRVDGPGIIMRTRVPCPMSALIVMMGATLRGRRR